MLLAMPTGQVQTFSLTVSQTQIPPVMNPQASSQPIGQSSKAVSVRIMIEQAETATSSRRGDLVIKSQRISLYGDRFGNCHVIHEKIRWKAV